MRPSPRAAAAAACALLCWFAPPARASAPIPFSRYHCDIQNAHGLRLHAWVPSAGADTTLGFTSVDAAANAWEVSPVAGAADGYTVRAATGMRSGAWLHLDAAGALVLLDAQPAGAWWNITCGIVSELRHAHCAFTHSSAAQPTLTRASIRAVTEHDDYLTSAHHHVEYHFWTYAHIGLSPGGGLVSDLDAPFQTWDFRKVPGRANHYWIVEADGAGRMIWHDTAAPCAYVSYQAGCPGDPPLNISAFVEDASLAWEVNHLHGRFYTLRAAASGLYLQAWSPDIEGWEFDSLAFVAERRAWRIASALHPLEGEVAALKTVNANAPAGAHNRFVGFDAAGAFGDDFADPQPLELRGVDGAADTYDIVSRRRPEHTASSRVVQYARSRWTGTGTPGDRVAQEAAVRRAAVHRRRAEPPVRPRAPAAHRRRAPRGRQALPARRRRADGGAPDLGGHAARQPRALPPSALQALRRPLRTPSSTSTTTSTTRRAATSAWATSSSGAARTWSSRTGTSTATCPTSTTRCSGSSSPPTARAPPRAARPATARTSSTTSTGLSTTTG